MTLPEFRALLERHHVALPQSETELEEMHRNWSALADVTVADFKERWAKGSHRSVESLGEVTEPRRSTLREPEREEGVAELVKATDPEAA